MARHLLLERAVIKRASVRQLSVYIETFFFFFHSTDLNCTVSPRPGSRARSSLKGVRSASACQFPQRRLRTQEGRSPAGWRGSLFPSVALTLGIYLDSKMQSLGGRRGTKWGDMSTVDMWKSYVGRSPNNHTETSG